MKIFRTQVEEDSIMTLMKEAQMAEKMKEIAEKAREVAKKQIEKYTNLNHDEKSDAALRLKQIDHHMYLDENSS